MLAASLLKPNVPHTDENILAAMERLRYPVLATLKIDGIRAIKLNQLVSRTLKPIPNRSIQARAMKLPAGFDMELYNPSLKYEEIESIVMSREHERSDEIQFHVLDWVIPSETYNLRCARIDGQFKNYTIWDMTFEYPTAYTTPERLFNFFADTEQSGGEGICFRAPNSPYKQGRSTLKEQYLVKLCRNITSEATILGFKEQFENGNRAKTSLLGLTERSSHGCNMYGKNTLGAISVRDTKSGLEFDIGTGFNDRLRREIWNNKQMWIGRVVTYKYKGGGKTLPRCPVYLHTRERDI
jgi:DNA ligase-1